MNEPKDAGSDAPPPLVLQPRLFWQPRFRPANRSELAAPGIYSPSLPIVMAVRGLSPGHKAVYHAALHHLRGDAATMVAVSIDRLAAMTDQSRRNTALGVSALQKAWLIDARRGGRSLVWRISFCPIDLWLRCRAPSFDPTLVSRLLQLFENEPALLRFVGAATSPATLDVAAPGDAPLGTAKPLGEAGSGPRSAPCVEDAAGPRNFERTAPSATGGRGAQGAQLLRPPSAESSQRGATFARNSATFSRSSAKVAPEALVQTANSNSAALEQGQSQKTRNGGPERRNGGGLEEANRDFPAWQAGDATLNQATDIARDWQDMLGLDDSATEEQVEDLTRIAMDLLAGKLGGIAGSSSFLATLAYEVGHRRPPARSPLGMFIALGVYRLRSANWGKPKPALAAQGGSHAAR